MKPGLFLMLKEKRSAMFHSEKASLIVAKIQTSCVFF